MEYILPCETPIFTLNINSPILIPGYKYSLTWNESMYTHFQNENFNTSLLETF